MVLAEGDEDGEGLSFFSSWAGEEVWDEGRDSHGILGNYHPGKGHP